MYMESTVIVCRASSSFVPLCVACARICFGMGDQTVLKGSENSQEE